MKKILVANRGEIAIRVIRAAQELGHKAVAIYETPDTEALHVRVADEAIWLGDGPRKDYLDIAKVIKAARKSGADAIHPGYGFLAENPEFAKACENAGLVFIGPTSEVITNLGNKVIAREIMAAANIPMVPGTSNLSPGDEGLQEALAFASEYGYPIMLKATAGGGGRGIRRIDNDSQMREELPMARTEAKAAFDNDNVYLEKVVINPKHVEVQIIADSFGEVVHLGTRDCSIQRRNQKLVEIAPSLIQDQSIIESICETAVKAAQASNYTNAGTVEFLVDKDMKYYFMEINTTRSIRTGDGEIPSAHQKNHQIKGIVSRDRGALFHLLVLSMYPLRGLSPSGKYPQTTDKHHLAMDICPLSNIMQMSLNIHQYLLRKLT